MKKLGGVAGDHRVQNKLSILSLSLDCTGLFGIIWDCFPLLGLSYREGKYGDGTTAPQRKREGSETIPELCRKPRRVEQP